MEENKKNTIVDLADEEGKKPPEIVGRALLNNRGSRKATANELGVSPATIAYWIRVGEISVIQTITTTVYVNGLELDTVIEEIER